MGHSVQMSIDRAHRGFLPWIVKIALEPALPRWPTHVDSSVERGVNDMAAAMEFSRKWLRDTMASEIDRRQKLARAADAFAALPPIPAR